MPEIKIIKRGGTTPQPIVDMNSRQQPADTNNGQQPASLPARLGFAALRGLDVPTNVFNLIDSYLGGDTRPIKPISEDIRERTGLTPEQLKPQGSLEEIAQNATEKLPTIAATGGGALQAGLGLLGSGARQGAKELGLGQGVQTGAEILSELFGSAYARGLRPGKIRSDLRPEMQSKYKSAESEIKNIPAQQVPSINSFIGEELEKLPASGLEQAAERTAKSQLSKVGSDIFQGKLKPTDVWKWKKHFNGLIGQELAKTDPNMGLVNLYSRTVGKLNENLQELSQKFPKFGENFNAAEDIFKGLDAPSVITKKLEDSTKLKNMIGSNPIAKTMAGLASLWKFGIPKTVALGVGATALPFAGRYVGRAYDLFSKSKTARNLAIKIAHDVGNDSMTSAANSFLKLEREVRRMEQQEKKEIKQGSRIKIIRRGI